MAFTTLTAGDHLIQELNCRPKIPKSGYTPRVGDVVTVDAATQDGVDLIAANEQFYGLVYNLNGWDSSNTTRPISVIEFQSGCVVILPYDSSGGDPIIGSHVEFASATPDAILGRTVVTKDDTNGDLRSKVVAKDAGTQFGTGYLALEFF